MKMIATYDLDGVLVDGDEPHERAVRQLCQEAGVTLTDGQFNLLMSKSMDDQWCLLPDAVKLKIGLDDFKSGVAARTIDIIKEEGVIVLPGAPERIKEDFLSVTAIAINTNGEGELPLMKVEAVIKEVNKLLAALEPPHDQIRMSMDDVVLIQRDKLPEGAKPKPHLSATITATRMAVENMAVKKKRGFGFGEDGYDPNDFMKHTVGYEDADGNMAGLVASGAGLVITPRFLQNTPQPGALFVESLKDERISKEIINRSLNAALASDYVPRAHRTPKPELL